AGGGGGEELERPGRRARRPGPLLLERLVAVGREQRLEHADAGHPVDHAVVDLRDRGEATAGEALDEPQLPERARAVERLRSDAAGELLQLRVVAGGRQARVADVAGGGEGRVVDPDCLALERRALGALAV